MCTPREASRPLVTCLLQSSAWKGRWQRCRSLCIIDEFGKGTLATDGVGLLAAALRQLATAAEPPKVVAATHFSELLNADYLPRLAAKQCTLHLVRRLRLLRAASNTSCDAALACLMHKPPSNTLI